jgi:hypothetical protein
VRICAGVPGQDAGGAQDEEEEDEGLSAGDNEGLPMTKDQIRNARGSDSLHCCQ